MEFGLAQLHQWNSAHFEEIRISSKSRDNCSRLYIGRALYLYTWLLKGFCILGYHVRGCEDDRFGCSLKNFLCDLSKYVGCT